jgi:cell division protein FtsW
MWGLSLLILIVQRDLGPAVIFFGVFIVMLYCASGRPVYVLMGLAAFLPAATLAYRLSDTIQRRADAWLDPWTHAADSAYQLVQGWIAMASGGILGVGLTQGRPGYIPAVHTDFVLAAIGEEMGLLGTLAVLGLYLALVARSFKIALVAHDPFNQLLAAGLATVLGLQTLTILGGVLGVLPLTGVTMPFISYGGSSLVTNFLILGLLLRISASAPAR